jgi:hypothetical protein
MSPPSLVLKNKASKNELLSTCFILVSFLLYFWTLNMGTTYSPETPVDFQRTALRNIEENGTF